MLRKFIALLLFAGFATDFLDWIKYVALDGVGFLSFGGEVRERFETYGNKFFRTNPNAHNAYFHQRYLFHADHHPADSVPVFAQLQSSPFVARAVRAARSCAICSSREFTTSPTLTVFSRFGQPKGCRVLASWPLIPRDQFV